MPTPIALVNQKPCGSCKDQKLKPMTIEEIHSFIIEIPDWSILNEEIIKVQKEFQCQDFIAAVEFTNTIADLAETIGHHPNIFIHSYNKLAITLYTHNINGVSKDDLIMAAKIDELWNLRNQFSI